MVAGEDSDYLGFGEALVEAYHDGYIEDMIYDVLNIPNKLADQLWQGAGNHILWTREFNSDAENAFQPFGKPFSWMISRAERGLGSPFCAGYMATYQLLLFTKFGKYDHIMPGVLRYDSPITLDDALFYVKCINGGWNDHHELGILDTARVLDKDLYDDGDVPTLDEYLQRQLARHAWIEGLETFKPFVQNDTIQYSIIGQTIELYWQRYLQSPPTNQPS